MISDDTFAYFELVVNLELTEELLRSMWENDALSISDRSVVYLVMHRGRCRCPNSVAFTGKPSAPYES